MLKINSRKNKGITLISIVITIIVLLILAGVSIAMLTGENGLLTQAQRAKEETENAAANEAAILEEYEEYLNSISGGTTSGLDSVTGTETSNTEVEDSLGNKVVIPAGFKVVNPEANVEDGIVIEDVSHEATAGSQFVWIPVGTIQTSSGEKTITLSRYTFDFDGTPTDQGTNIIESYYQELSTSTYGNTVAKDIEGFIESAEENGGYYLGRYEARTATSRTSSGDDLTQITEKPDEYVYNYVTQPQAASLSQGMYSDSNFESDLVNSYAWDTAIVFIQECSGDSNYSMRSSLNDVSLATQGTNNLNRQDVVCNIYDMASNCFEWTTETFSDASYPCVHRGGFYENLTFYTYERVSTSTSLSTDYIAFRPLLYL